VIFYWPASRNLAFFLGTSNPLIDSSNGTFRVLSTGPHWPPVNDFSVTIVNLPTMNEPTAKRRATEALRKIIQAARAYVEAEEALDCSTRAGRDTSSIGREHDHENEESRQLGTSGREC
jgi:hypothetical protein